MKTTPLIVVTGAIASGKSTVAEILAAGGGVLLKADQLAHKALEMDAVRKSLLKEYGDAILDRSGEVSRRKLGSIALKSPEEMEKLNRLVTPAVTVIINRAVEQAAGSRYIVLDAVLFFKYTFEFRADVVITAEASEETRIERLIGRDRLSREQAEKRVKSQRYLYRDWARGDININTEKDLAELTAEVEELRESIIRNFVANGGGGENG